MSFSIAHAVLGAVIGVGLACLVFNIADYWRGTKKEDR